MKVWLALMLMLLVGAFTFGLALLGFATLSFWALLCLMGLVTATAVFGLYLGYYLGRARR